MGRQVNMTVKLDNVGVTDWLEQALRELPDGPVFIEREGQTVGVLIAPEMIELLDRLEDVSYRDIVAEALAEPEEVSWDQVKAESKALP